ncbi:3-hydroxyacyl-CoA dehydrogenase/enoyl-CoA hydratase family protein, partial [Desulfosarcina sp.]|uniref:3-hydroxyacyl-CoA dehydrogenase/enoyl-CoA hydratase family protein n=1 Tax=Desulfosarcina sp. TaxID=2027861 RepID=UPI003970DDCC
FVGLHFFYHPAKNRLLEIIPGSKTSAAALAAARKYAKLTGKTDILVKDAPGFAVNRFFQPFLNEAIRVLDEEIANIPTIEKAAMDCLGIGMGPFELMNVTGIPIGYHTQNTLHGKLGEFYAPAKGLVAQFTSGEAWNLAGEIEADKFDAVNDRLLGSIFFTTTSLLDEGVTDIMDADVGAKVGLRWRKGAFEIMNELGIEKAFALVESLLKPYLKVAAPGVLAAQKAKGLPWDVRYVKYIQDGSVGRVRISRPDALNALNQAVVKQLDEAFRKAEADPQTKAIIIEGAGKAFVAGADIKFFVDCIKQDRIADNYDFTSYGHEVLNRIDDSRKTVVAKMEGLALGGGLELAMAADVIAATPKAVMGFPETGIGIYPGLGGTQRTSRHVGIELAKYLVFSGRILSAKDAEAIGLVDYIFEADEIDEKILGLIESGRMTANKGRGRDDLPEDWKKIKDLFSDLDITDWLEGKYLDSDDPLVAKTAKIISTKAPLALKFANRIMDAGYGKPLKEGLKEELAHLNEIFSTKDALTGLTNVGRKGISYEGK